MRCVCARLFFLVPIRVGAASFVTDKKNKRRVTHTHRMVAHTPTSRENFRRALGRGVIRLEEGVEDLLKLVNNAAPTVTVPASPPRTAALRPRTAALQPHTAPLRPHTAAEIAADRIATERAAAAERAAARTATETTAAATAAVLTAVGTNLSFDQVVRAGVQEFLKTRPATWARQPKISARRRDHPHTTVHQLRTPFRVLDGVEVIAVIHHAPSPAPVAVVLEHQPGQPRCTLRLVPVYNDQTNAAEVITEHGAAHQAALNACDGPLKRVERTVAAVLVRMEAHARGPTDA